MSARDLIILGCSSQQPTRFRNHGAYLFRWNDEGLLFDPGEGTQRQFIFANIAPPVITRVFISHFHGDHCLGFGSMLMRLGLDNITHDVHCYYPASGKKYLDRLRYGTICHHRVNLIEHPVEKEGLVHDDGKFRIEAAFLEHGVENIGWRITEPDMRKFSKEKLATLGIKGPLVRQLQQEGRIEIEGNIIDLDDVSWIRKGDSIAIVIDTRTCPQAISLAQNARILLCESTYLEEFAHLAKKHYHMTAKEAALIAQKADVQQLILTHFSARHINAKAFQREARTIFPNSYAAEDLKVFPFPLNPPKKK